MRWCKSFPVCRDERPCLTRTQSISNAALALRSFPDLRTRIGRRFGGHFRSHVFARVPKSVLMPSGESDYGRKSWGVAAKVLTGNDQRTQLQYHIQLSLFYCPQYESRYCEIVSELPRYGTAPVEAQIDNLGTDILIGMPDPSPVRMPTNSWI